MSRPRIPADEAREIAARKEAEAALRASEERLRAHIDNSPLAIVQFAPDFTVTHWSKAAERLFGWSASEVIGRPIGGLHWVHEEDVESVRRETDRLLSGECSSSKNVNRNYRKDGSVIHCEWYSSALHDAQGRLVSVLSQVLDVTELRTAERELRETDRRKSDFLAVLSHELRNPLAPIRNSLALLDRAPPGSEAARRARDVLHRQTEHLARLVDDLLDITRISRGKIELRRVRIDARDVARRACDDLRSVAEQRSVALELTLSPEAVWVDADAVRLAQMIDNLLTNALKFTPAGGRVEVAVQRRRDACEISVRDTGAGIAPQDLECIFDPFAQAERTRERAQGGVGIGLSLVRQLATLHGGSVRARSDGLERGAEFALELPLVGAPGPEASPRAAGQAARGLSIVIVEDNEDAGTTLAELFQVMGHRASVRRTGRAGVEAVKDGQPDVLICDVGLPDMRGYDVIREIRRDESGGRVFAVALTGYTQPEDVARAAEAGFDAHLPKPPPLGRLEELLARVSSRRSR